MEMQSSTDPEGGASECVSETEPLWHSSELEESAGLTPETDMDDCDSLISDRTLSVSTDPRIPPHDSAWALALYGEDSFSQDVLNYAQKLSSHCQSPTLEDKSQVRTLLIPTLVTSVHHTFTSCTSVLSNEVYLRIDCSKL